MRKKVQKIMSSPSLSIHPRNWPQGNKQKRNTAKPAKDATKGIQGKRMRKLNDRRVARVNTLLDRNINETAFKNPGSQAK